MEKNFDKFDGWWEECCLNTPALSRLDSHVRDLLEDAFIAGGMFAMEIMAEEAMAQLTAMEAQLRPISERG